MKGKDIGGGAKQPPTAALASNKIKIAPAYKTEGKSYEEDKRMI